MKLNRDSHHTPAAGCSIQGVVSKKMEKHDCTTSTTFKSSPSWNGDVMGIFSSILI